MMNKYNIEFKVIASVDNEYTDYISKQTQRARMQYKRYKPVKPNSEYYPARVAENGL